MPALVAWIVSAIGGALVSWLVRVLLGFGLAVATTTIALPPLRAFMMSHMAGMPAMIVSMIGYMGIDRGLAMIFSGMAIAAASRVSLKNKSQAPA